MATGKAQLNNQLKKIEYYKRGEGVTRKRLAFVKPIKKAIVYLNGNHMTWEQLAREYIWFPCNEEHLHFHLFGPVSEGSSDGKNKQKRKQKLFIWVQFMT